MVVARLRGRGATPDRRAAFAPVGDLLVQFGTDPIAASLDQPRVELLAHAQALLGYRRAGRFTVTLGGAVGEPAAQLPLWRAFFRANRQGLASYLAPADVAIVRAAEPTLHVVPFGAEYIVSPRVACLAIPRVAASAARKAARKGLALEEVGSFTAWRHELAELNARFIARSPIGEELEFLNRPALLDRACARRFLIRRAGTLIGFVELDRAPAQPEAYLLNIIRFDRCNVWGVYHWIVYELVNRLATVENATLSLGFSPMSPRALAVGEVHAPAFVERQVEFLVARRNAFHGFESIENMKAVWPHEVRVRHLAFRTRNVVAAGNAVCAAIGMPWQRVALRRLAAAWRGLSSHR